MANCEACKHAFVYMHVRWAGHICASCVCMFCTPGWLSGAASAGAVLDDVALVWANCRQYNEPTSELLPLCTAAEVDFWQRWQDAGLPTGLCELCMQERCRARTYNVLGKQ